MAHVFWTSSDDFVPTSLSRVSFDKITVELDTSKHYIQVCYIYTTNVKIFLNPLGILAERAIIFSQCFFKIFLLVDL